MILSFLLALDSLSIDIKSGKYYYDLGEELDEVAVGEGFMEFFKQHFHV